MHSRYRRKPADLPSLGRRVGVSLRMRRFYCRNARCARRTFAEHLPELVAPSFGVSCAGGASRAAPGRSTAG